MYSIVVTSLHNFIITIAVPGDPDNKTVLPDSHKQGILLFFLLLSFTGLETLESIMSSDCDMVTSCASVGENGQRNGWRRGEDRDMGSGGDQGRGDRRLRGHQASPLHYPESQTRCGSDPRTPALFYVHNE